MEQEPKQRTGYRRPRLIDIAKRLNVTKVTVSKALRDHPDISRETRALVKKVAAEMKYTPDLLARSLSARKTYTIGVVVPKVAHAFFASVIDAIQARATEAGYGILLAVSNERASLEREHLERLLAMRVDGLLVSVTKEPPDLEIYRRIHAMQVPLVFFDRRIPGLPFSSVTVTDRESAFAAVDHMIRRGYRRIAHIAGTPDVEIGRERRAGYEAALHAHGIPVREEWIIEGGFDECHGYRSFERLCRAGELPEVIFTVTYPVGLGVYRAMLELDPELPERIQLLTFGSAGLNEFSGYRHYCVRQPTRELGERAVELLLRQMGAGEGWEVEHVALRTELIAPDDFSRYLRRVRCEQAAASDDGAREPS
jgi:LacI family transcriptional regulator